MSIFDELNFSPDFTYGLKNPLNVITPKSTPTPTQERKNTQYIAASTQIDSTPLVEYVPRPLNPTRDAHCQFSSTNSDHSLKCTRCLTTYDFQTQPSGPVLITKTTRPPLALFDSTIRVDNWWKFKIPNSDPNEPKLKLLDSGKIPYSDLDTLRKQIASIFELPTDFVATITPPSAIEILTPIPKAPAALQATHATIATASTSKPNLAVDPAPPITSPSPSQHDDLSSSDSDEDSSLPNPSSIPLPGVLYPATPLSDRYFAALADLGYISKDPDLSVDIYDIISSTQRIIVIHDPERQSRLKFDYSTAIDNMRDNSKLLALPVVKNLLGEAARQHTVKQCENALLGITHECQLPHPCPIRQLAHLMSIPRASRPSVPARNFFESLLLCYLDVTLKDDDDNDKLFLFATNIKSKTVRSSILSSDDGSSARTSSSRSKPRKHKRKASFFSKRK